MMCGHCGYAPARQDRRGYCSWDCHDHAYPAPEPTMAMVGGRPSESGAEPPSGDPDR